MSQRPMVIDPLTGLPISGDPGVDPRMGFPSPPAAQPGLLGKLSGAFGGPQGLMNLGANLMAQSGPSPVKQGFGSILGNSLLSNQQFQRDSNRDMLEEMLLRTKIQQSRQRTLPKTHVVGNALVDDEGRVIYKSEALDNIYGRINPGDYTPESLAKFDKSKDYRDLVRVWAPPSPTVVNMGGAPNLVQGDRNGAAPRIVALSTQEVEIEAARRRAAAEASAAASGKIIGEREGKAPTAYAAYKAGVAGLEKAMNETATGPIIGRSPALTAKQQTAEGAEATMAPILKDLFRSSGEGTFTEGDQALLLKMVPTRLDHEEARKAKLAMIDEIVRAKLGIGVDGVAPSTGGSDIDALLDKYAPKK